MTTSLDSSISRRTGLGCRARGAALAAGISFAVAAALAGAAEALEQSGVGEILALCSLGAAIGVPVGAVLGWLHAPTAVASQGSDRLVLVIGLATVAVPIGAALVSIGMALGGAVGRDSGADLAGVAGSAATLFFVGLIVFGIPAWVLAAVVCAVWVAVVGAADREQSAMSE